MNEIILNILQDLLNNSVTIFRSRKITKHHIFILFQIEPLIYKINKTIIKLNNNSPCRVEPAAIAENAQHDPHDNSRC